MLEKVNFGVFEDMPASQRKRDHPNTENEGKKEAKQKMFA